MSNEKEGAAHIMVHIMTKLHISRLQTAKRSLPLPVYYGCQSAKPVFSRLKQEMMGYSSLCSKGRMIYIHQGHIDMQMHAQYQKILLENITVM